jgi:hypothetical protein
MEQTLIKDIEYELMYGTKAFDSFKHEIQMLKRSATISNFNAWVKKNQAEYNALRKAMSHEEIANRWVSAKKLKLYIEITTYNDFPQEQQNFLLRELRSIPLLYSFYSLVKDKNNPEYLLEFAINHGKSDAITNTMDSEFLKQTMNPNSKMYNPDLARAYSDAYLMDRPEFFGGAKRRKTSRRRRRIFIKSRRSRQRSKRS